MLRTINDKNELDKSLVWIRPDGGITEAMILSGLLYGINSIKGKKFGMFRQMPYSMLLYGHPAVAQFGIPPEDFNIVTTAYRMKEAPGAGDKRPYNIMSRILEGSVIGPEKLWVSMEEDITASLKYFPVSSGAVFIATGRESKGGFWDLKNWNMLAKMLEKHTGRPVIQIGNIRDERVDGAFDLRGRAGLKQTLALIREKASAVISLDSYFHLGAKWAQKPAIVLWGSVERPAYGYDDQINLENPAISDDNKVSFDPELVFEAAKKIIGK